MQQKAAGHGWPQVPAAHSLSHVSQHMLHQVPKVRKMLVITGAAWQLASQVRLPEGLHVSGRGGGGYCRRPCLDEKKLAVRRPKAGLHGLQHLL